MMAYLCESYRRVFRTQANRRRSDSTVWLPTMPEGTMAVETQSVDILDCYSVPEDPRQRTKVIYPLPEILLLVLCGVMAGADDFSEITRWGKRMSGSCAAFSLIVRAFPPTTRSTRCLPRSTARRSATLSCPGWRGGARPIRTARSSPSTVRRRGARAPRRLGSSPCTWSRPGPAGQHRLFTSPPSYWAEWSRSNSSRAASCEREKGCSASGTFDTTPWATALPRPR